MKKILITGGLGLIGSALVENFVKKNKKIYIIDNCSTGRLNNLSKTLRKKIIFYKGSVVDDLLIRGVIKKVDFVYHLAAAVGLRRILTNKIDSLETNVTGTHNVIRACADFNKKLIIASSSEVYGLGVRKKLKEHDNSVIGSSKRFRWSYACSKLVDEHMALAYFQEKRLKVNIVRFFNVVGPAQTSDYGMVVPNFIECALNNKDIKVYGDGKQTRTFLHVKDAIVALDKLYSYKKYGNIFNLGGIENISMFNLAAKIRKIIGSNSKIKKINYNYAYSNRKIFSKDYEDINYRDPSISFIKKELNFFPNINLSKILKDIISFKKL